MSYAVPAVVLVAVVAFWVFVSWRVAVERGQVLRPPRPRTPFEIAVAELRDRFVDLGAALSSALLPAIEAANAAMVAWAKTFQPIRDALAENAPHLLEGDEPQ